MIDSFRKVLFVGAHPDDETACSGLLSLLSANGACIDFLTFSDCRDQIPEGFTIDDLHDEWREALGLFNVGRRTLLVDIPNQHFPDHRQAILQEMVDRRDAGYDLVLLPASSDCHQDHSVVREEGIRAFKHTTILGYEHPQNSVRAVPMQCYVVLDEDDMEQKLAHAATYRTQAHRTYMQTDFIEAVARMRGVQAGAQYAEALEVVRWVM